VQETRRRFKTTLEVEGDPTCLINDASSTGRRNTFLKFNRRSLKS